MFYKHHAIHFRNFFIILTDSSHSLCPSGRRMLSISAHRISYFVSQKVEILHLLSYFVWLFTLSTMTSEFIHTTLPGFYFNLKLFYSRLILDFVIFGSRTLSVLYILYCTMLFRKQVIFTGFLCVCVLIYPAKNS